MGHVLYILLVFLSAFLLFLVQPAFAKAILPLFGGGAGVWSVCLVFFQTNLFLGYLYSHLLQKFSQKKQVYIHLAMIFFIAVFFPLAFDHLSKAAIGGNPYKGILYLLAVNLGLPFFLLSTTSVLAQSWHARTEKKHTYELYAYSNAGSLLALVSYPFLVEPHLDLSQQFRWWNVLFGVYAVFYLICAVKFFKRTTKKKTSPASEIATVRFSLARDDSMMMLKCFVLAMMGSAMLVAATNRLCNDIAPFPFLWIMPLAIYLLTFIFCFARKRFYFRERWPVWAALMILLVANPLVLESSIFFAVPLVLATLFCCLMVAHGEISLMKPSTNKLTSFYLALCAGGAVGSALISLAAPFIFPDYYEFHLLLAAFLVYSVWLLVFGTNTRVSWKRHRREAVEVLVFCICAILLGVGCYVWDTFCDTHPVRNFYGVNFVKNAGRYRGLFHGRILHGACFNNPAKEMTPISYYCPGSGVDTAFKKVREMRQRPLRVGGLGLGAGSIAGYGQEGDQFVFYEINPNVIKLAKEKFPFINKTKASVEIVEGDARLSLEKEASRQFDILVLDVFNSDAIPMHLLTKEAFAVYLRHLAPDGFLVVHVSNIYFDLFLPMTAIAKNFHLYGARYYLIPTERRFPLNGISHYAILSRQPFDFDTHEENSDVYYEKMLPDDDSALWTDRFSSVFPVLKALPLPSFITDYFVKRQQEVVYREMDHSFRKTCEQWREWNNKQQKSWKDWDKRWQERMKKLDQEIEEMKKSQ